MSESGKFHYQNLDRRRDRPVFRLTPQGSRANGEGGLVHFADARRLKTLCPVKGAGYRMHSTDPERVTCPDCLERLQATKNPHCAGLAPGSTG